MLMQKTRYVKDSWIHSFYGMSRLAQSKGGDEGNE